MIHLDGEVPLREDREALLDLAVDTLYAEGPSTEFVRLDYSDGSSETLHLRDFVSGASLRNIVDRAKKNAVKDFLATGVPGISREHVLAAIAAESAENEDLPSGAHPDDWARISGRRGRRVEQVTPLRGLQGPEGLATTTTHDQHDQEGMLR